MKPVSELSTLPQKEKVWHLGLTGWPLGHSLSLCLHQTALDSLGLVGDYQLFPIPTTTHADIALKLLLSSIRNGALDGLNVTVPYKQTVIQFLDRLSAPAKIVGAVNTIYLKDGLLVGDNTDIVGFQTDLARLESRVALIQNKQALVLGAGGSARAVVYVLLREGWDVTIAARRVEQAEDMSTGFGDLSPKIKVIPLNDVILQDQANLIVNTTPLGMYPEAQKSPWPAGFPLPKHAIVYDLIYNPQQTLLVQSASIGMNGLGMLVEQAALSFELWTGVTAPR
jgi:shikimate dehydrogenase